MLIPSYFPFPLSWPIDFPPFRLLSSLLPSWIYNFFVTFLLKIKALQRSALVLSLVRVTLSFVLRPKLFSFLPSPRSPSVGAPIRRLGHDAPGNRLFNWIYFLFHLMFLSFLRYFKGLQEKDGQRHFHQGPLPSLELRRSHTEVNPPWRKSPRKHYV